MPKIDRRDFIKIGAVSTSIFALERYFNLFGQIKPVYGKQVSRTTGKFRKEIYSTCLNCFARCGIIGYVEEGRLLKIGGNPSHPNNLGSLCAKGQAGVNMVYDTQRILHPLKRVGARGEGKWKRISWDEALSEVASKLIALQRTGHPEEFAYQSERDITTQDFARRFMYAFGSHTVLNHITLGGANKKLARELSWGVDVDIGDVAYTEYVLNFGANPYEAHILRTGFIKRLATTRSMRMAGEKVLHKSKIVTFDPRCSQTAGKSDEWFPINPGTDGLVALSMAHVIMKEGLFDRNFINTWCNYPLDELMKHLGQYTPEAAEAASGIKSSDIRRIAREFATTKPALTISSGGVTKHLNGASNERCIALLSAITGNIDTRGGNCFPRTYQFEEPDPKPTEPQVISELSHPHEFPLASHLVSNKVLSMIKEGRQKISVYMIYEHNPAYRDPQCDVSSDILKNEGLIPYFVAIGSYMTESAALADIILPAATYLERLELESPPSLEMVPFVSIRQPVVRPIGEVRPFMDILIELAKKIDGGMEKYFAFSGSEEYWGKAIRTIEGLVKAGGLKYLKRHGLWYDQKAIPEYKSYKKKGFNTPSGKFEIYSKRLEDHGFAPLPAYTPINDYRKKEKDEFVLIIYQPNVHTHGDTANAILLSEITHKNGIWINSDKARSMGIKKGDLIEITSQVGSIKAEAHTTAGINPRVLAISDSCGHWEYGMVAKAKKFKSQDPFTGHIWWEEEGNGTLSNPIIPIASDPIGGGQAWMDTKVRITKVEKKLVEKSFIEKLLYR